MTATPHPAVSSRATPHRGVSSTPKAPNACAVSNIRPPHASLGFHLVNPFSYSLCVRWFTEAGHLGGTQLIDPKSSHRFQTNGRAVAATVVAGRQWRSQRQMFAEFKGAWLIDHPDRLDSKRLHADSALHPPNALSPDQAPLPAVTLEDDMVVWRLCPSSAQPHMQFLDPSEANGLPRKLRPRALVRDGSPDLVRRGVGWLLLAVLLGVLWLLQAYAPTHYAIFGWMGVSLALGAAAWYNLYRHGDRRGAAYLGAGLSMITWAVGSWFGFTWLMEKYRWAWVWHWSIAPAWALVVAVPPALAWSAWAHRNRRQPLYRAAWLLLGLWGAMVGLWIGWFGPDPPTWRIYWEAAQPGWLAMACICLTAATQVLLVAELVTAVVCGITGRLLPGRSGRWARWPSSRLLLAWCLSGVGILLLLPEVSSDVWSATVNWWSLVLSF